MLDTIGTDENKNGESGSTEETKEDGTVNSIKQKISAMAGSDLEMLVMGKVSSEEHPVWDTCQFLKPKDDKKPD